MQIDKNLTRKLNPYRKCNFPMTPPIGALVKIKEIIHYFGCYCNNFGPILHLTIKRQTWSNCNFNIWLDSKFKEYIVLNFDWNNFSKKFICRRYVVEMFNDLYLWQNGIRLQLQKKSSFSVFDLFPFKLKLITINFCNGFQE